MLKDHITKIDLDLRLFKFIVQPLVLLLNNFTCEHLSEAFLPCFLESFLIKLFGWGLLLFTFETIVLALLWLVYCPSHHKNLRWKTADTVLSPSHDILFYHEEKTFRINLARVNLSLKSANFVTPRHWLPLNAIGSKFH